MLATSRDIRILITGVMSREEHERDSGDQTLHLAALAHLSRTSDATDCPTSGNQKNIRNTTRLKHDSNTSRNEFKCRDGLMKTLIQYYRTTISTYNDRIGRAQSRVLRHGIYTWKIRYEN